ncbi:hypothetical protein [Streptomyces sp. NPDC006463]
MYLEGARFAKTEENGRHYCVSGWLWQTPCHCVDCTIKAKSAQRSSA